LSTTETMNSRMMRDTSSLMTRREPGDSRVATLSSPSNAPNPRCGSTSTPPLATAAATTAICSGVARSSPCPNAVLASNDVDSSVPLLVSCDGVVSVVKLGIGGSQVMLQGGCNDFGGTLMEETISRMAGANHGIKTDPAEFNDAIRAIGRTPAQRTTTYDQISIVAG